MMLLAQIAHALLGLVLAVVLGYTALRRRSGLAALERCGLLGIAAGYALALWQLGAESQFEDARLAVAGQLAIALGLLALVFGWLLRTGHRRGRWRQRLRWQAWQDTVRMGYPTQPGG